MKFVRVFLRIFLRIAALCVVAAVFVELTGLYGNSTETPVPIAAWQKERSHRASAPDIRKISEFGGEIVLLGVLAAIGRVLFRLRLSPASPREEQTISLDLNSKPLLPFGDGVDRR